MLFNSISFALFFTIVFLCYWALPHRFRWALILLANVYFYLSFNVSYLLILGVNILYSYFAAKKIKGNKKLLIVSIIICLLSLLICKYTNFTIKVLNDIGLHFSNGSLKIILPVGISFYTFEIISYLIDVYKGKIEAENELKYYATYISFFPTISSGPIERTNSIINQLKEEKKFDYDKAVYGMLKIAWGLFKKIVIADNLAVYVDTVFASLHDYFGFNLILIAIFYSVQIYCDFSGYTDMAIGVSNLLGIDLSENFHNPYFAKTIKDFWARWHITLTSWFRDYIYIPLGGNRKGKLRKYLNIMIVFLVSGLWHGANYTFILWGILHGVSEIIEDIFHINPSKKHGILSFAQVVWTFCIVSIFWVIFRADNISDAFYFIKSIPIGITNLRQYFITGIYSFNNTPKYIFVHCLIYLIPLVFVDVMNEKNDFIKRISRYPFFVRYILYAILILFILLFHSTNGTSFIYFKF